MLRRFLFISIILLALPLVARAQEATGATASKVPEFNPLCWTAKQCCSVRANLSNGKIKQTICDQIREDETDEKVFNGWVHDGICQKKWGKCLPSGETQTQVAFGGRRDFLHVGDFIQNIYKYAIGIAGILAVLMIIVAGFQWITSGGNSEAITSAKNRIAGALMGAFLAYCSFFILNTLNPALVQLRLPKVWMTRPQSLVPEYCSVLPKDTTFSLAADTDNQISVPPPNKPDFDKPLSLTNPQTQDAFYCGKRFYFRDGKNDSVEQTCFGNYCEGNRVCVDFAYSGKPRTQRYYCVDGTIALKIGNSGAIKEPSCPGLPGPFNFEGWEFPDMTNAGEAELWIVCNRGANVFYQKSEINADVNGIQRNDGQDVILAASQSEIDEEVAACNKDKGGVKGFVIKLEMNEQCDPKDENHWFGYDGNNAVDLGDDDIFLDKEFKKQKFEDSSIFKRGGMNYFNQRYFIPLEKIKSGLQLNVDANIVRDIDETEDEEVYNKLLQ